MIDVIKIPDNYLPDKLLYQWDFFVLFYFYQTLGEIESSVFKISQLAGGNCPVAWSIKIMPVFLL